MPTVSDWRTTRTVCFLETGVDPIARSGSAMDAGVPAFSDADIGYAAVSDQTWLVSRFVGNPGRDLPEFDGAAVRVTESIRPMKSVVAGETSPWSHEASRRHSGDIART